MREQFGRPDGARDAITSAQTILDAAGQLLDSDRLDTFQPD